MKKFTLVAAALGFILLAQGRADAFGFRLGPEFVFHSPENQTLMSFGFDNDYRILGPLNFHSSGLLGFNGNMMTWDALLGLKLKFPISIILLGIRADFVMRGIVPFDDDVYNSAFALGGSVAPVVGFKLGRFELFVDIDFQFFKYLYPDDVFINAPGDDEMQYALYLTPGFRF